MGSNGKRQRRFDFPINRQQRESIESELSAIPTLDPRFANLMSVAGFIDYYLRRVGLYPVSYTHRTLPTIYSIEILVDSGSLKNK